MQSSIRPVPPSLSLSLSLSLSVPSSTHMASQPSSLKLGLGKWLKVAKYIDASAVVKYNFKVLFTLFKELRIVDTVCFSPTTSRRQMLYFSLHYNYSNFGNFSNFADLDYQFSLFY